MITKHLDLGCGSRPRNPFNCDELYGVDITKPQNITDDFNIATANLAIEKIPYPDDFFDSVSAFDFLEHVPRVLNGGELGTRFPFIELMNEVWRVLKKEGIFYALTPAYPSEEAFVDPTHVNFISKNTHAYFCEGRCYGKNYGFNGMFKPNRVERVYPRLHYKLNNGMHVKLKTFFKLLKLKPKTHILWDLKAIKHD